MQSEDIVVYADTVYLQEVLDWLEDVKHVDCVEEQDRTECCETGTAQAAATGLTCPAAQGGGSYLTPAGPLTASRCLSEGESQDHNDQNMRKL